MGIMKKLETLKKITGNEEMELNEEDIEGDFDPEKYDKKMQELFSNYDKDIAVDDEEKPTFSDLDDDDYDEDDDGEDWDNWTAGEGGDKADDLNCEDKRIKKRKEVEERKKREKEIKKEELKMLKNMKKKEIMKKLETLKKITGNEDMELNEEDIEGDFDPEKYGKKMQELFSNY